MKQSDTIAIIVFVLLALLVFFFPWGTTGLLEKTICWAGIDFKGSFADLTGLKNFGAVVNEYPYISGFIKVAVLASFGEMIKTRGRTGSYYTERLWLKFIVWGLFGMLFTIVFPIFAIGIDKLCNTQLWPFHSSDSFWNTLIFAFSTSLWLNLIFCYPMMLAHEWFNACIKDARIYGGAAFFRTLNADIWGSFLPKTILFFWIPAHTITFCLPPDYRILMSAFLSLALGFILTIKK